MNTMQKFLGIGLLMMATFSFVFGQISSEYQSLWNDPKVNETINNNIETFRKGDAVLEIVTKDGEPVKDAQIQLEQTEHEFLFGCNLFFLKGFDTEQENQKYETLFARINNFATAPFYWSDLEPEPGKIRFGKDSEAIFRRPPPDLLVDYARKYNITLKGHPLVWFAYYPQWLVNRSMDFKNAIEKRMSEIAARYAKEIPIWDVVNESLVRRCEGDMRWKNNLPPDYVPFSFKTANRFFTDDNILMINDVTTASHEYHCRESRYYLQISNLLAHGIRIDGIGFQFHIFSEQRYKDIIAGKYMTPQHLLNVYSLYQDFDRPLYITEITIPTLGETGEQDQAELVRNFYRLWFSMPNMAGITWWNLGDGTALERENQWNGGLVDKDLNQKESYKVLDQLINQTWSTTSSGATNQNGAFAFRGFYGQYSVQVRAGNKTQTFEIDLSKDGSPRHVLVMD